MSRAVAWVPAVAWAGILVFLSSRPSLPGPGVPQFDKVAHLAAYAVLGGLLALATARSGWPPIVAVALGLAFGVVDEVHQSFVPGRAASFIDWVADAVGVLVSVHLVTRWRSAPARAGARAGAQGA